ncbi:MAG: DeoR/GlpR family DNA-binding transcription regulator [Anaerolineae bacterium]
MNNSLFLEERRHLILEDLKQNGRVSVKILSDKLGVSEVTIRQDLRALEEEGVLERTYGGAMLRSASSTSAELSFDIRRRKHKAEKDAIGRAAAALVRDGYGIALDGSTTSFAMTPYLKPSDGLTIVTNSLMIAQQFLDSPRIRILMPAGRLRQDSISLVGSPETLADINLNLGFFGVRGLAFAAGITELSPEEADMKRAMMKLCYANVVLADSSKWGLVSPYTFAEARDISRIITASGCPPEEVEKFRALSVQVDVIDG